MEISLSPKHLESTRSVKYLKDDPQDLDKIKGELEQLLYINPQAISYLTDIQSSNPDKISMLVIPNFPVIVYQKNSKNYALVPGIYCNRRAIKDLFENTTRVGWQYDIFTSDNKLETLAWNTATKDENCTFHYVKETMNPSDYLALAVRGVFKNENPEIPLNFNSHSLIQNSA